MKKKIFIIALIIIIIVAAIVLVKIFTKNNNNRKGSDLRTTKVERGDIAIKVTESGEVEPITTVEIKSEYSGEVKELYVEEGDSVKEGDKLAMVQQESSKAQQIASAKASFERAKLDLDEAERDLNRKKELYQKGFIALKEVEDAQKAFENSKIQHELSEKQLWLILGGSNPKAAQSLSEKTFDHIVLKSPMPGVVISLNVEEGEMITSGTQSYGGGGTTVMTIADLSKMIVRTNVNEVDVGKVKAGQDVEIGFDAIRGKVFKGVVRKIAPAGTISGNVVVYPIEVEILGSTSGTFQTESQGRGGFSREQMFSQLTEEQRQEIRKEMQALMQSGASREDMRAAMQKKFEEMGVTPPEEAPPPEPELSKQPEGLQRSGIELIKPGMTADLNILIAQKNGVLNIPQEAVIEKNDKTTVLVIENGKQVSREVVTGLEGEISVEIVEGLDEGEEVVLNPLSLEQSGDASHESGGPPPH